MKKRENQRAPRFEWLEARVALSGTVSVVLGDGNLQVVGDAKPNDIAITQTASGRFTIAGNDGERFRVTGQRIGPGPVTVFGVMGGVLVSLGDGDDVVTIRGRSPSAPFGSFLTVIGGPGGARVDIADVRTGGPEFDPNITVPRELQKQARFMGRASFENALTFGSLTIDTASGRSDDVSVERVTILGSTVIATGAGDGRIALDSVSGRHAPIATSGGGDRIEVADRAPVAVATLDMRLGDGDDRVTIGPGRLNFRARALNAFLAARGRNSLLGLRSIDPRSLGTLLDPRLTGFRFVR